MVTFILDIENEANEEYGEIFIFPFRRLFFFQNINRIH